MSRINRKPLALVLAVLLGSATIAPALVTEAQAVNLLGGALKGKLGAVLDKAAAQGGMPAEMAGLIDGIASGDPAALRAFQGKIFAIVLKGLKDEIEIKNARSLVNAALQSGETTKKSFKNSKGEEVTVTTKVKEVKKKGTTCRELTTSVERNGDTAEGGGTESVCQMKLADGTVGYPPME